MTPQRKPEDYTFGWISALSREKAALFFDEAHPSILAQDHDTYYSCGSLHGHNVALVSLAGDMGLIATTRETSKLLDTFKNLKAVLLVGVAGGAPLDTQDIRLGDIVVTEPTKFGSGVVQYDFGTSRKDSFYIRDLYSGRPSRLLLRAVEDLNEEDQRTSQYDCLGHRLLDRTNSIARQFSKLSGIERPDVDQLFHSSYPHQGEENLSCSECHCDLNFVKKRKDRNPNVPHVHRGLIASGSAVIRNAATRDDLARERGVLCFEMEAAGLCTLNIPWLVIRGICDYSDSHKNKAWQDHAAAVAAEYAKEVLRKVPLFADSVVKVNAFGHSSAVDTSDAAERKRRSLSPLYGKRPSKKRMESLSDSTPPDMLNLFSLAQLNGDFRDRNDKMREIREHIGPSNAAHVISVLSITGIGGCGKTQLAAKYCRESTSVYGNILWLNAHTAKTLDIDIIQAIRGKIRAGDPQSQEAAELCLSYMKEVLEVSDRRWLLVLDGFDHPEQFDYNITRYFPTKGVGDIMITSQRSLIELSPMIGRNNVDAENLEKEEAYDIMFPKHVRDREAYTENSDLDLEKHNDTSKRNHLTRPRVERSLPPARAGSFEAFAADETLEDRILERLGYHALSVDIARSVLQKPGWTLRKLYERFFDLSESPLSMAGHQRYRKYVPDALQGISSPDTCSLVPATPELLYRLALEDLKRRCHDREEQVAMEQVLAIVAQFHHDTVNSDYFTTLGRFFADKDEIYPWMSPFLKRDTLCTNTVWSEISFLEKLYQLMELHLIKRSHNDETITMHPLMRDSLLRSLSREAYTEAKLAAIVMIIVFMAGTLLDRTRIKDTVSWENMNRVITNILWENPWKAQGKTQIEATSQILSRIADLYEFATRRGYATSAIFLTAAIPTEAVQRHGTVSIYTME